MVKQRVVFKSGKFTDYTGKERDYVVAAVSQLFSGSVQSINDKFEYEFNFVNKKLSLGFAICSAEDKFNLELGKEIALGKALKRPSRIIFATDTGSINNKVVEAFIDQEMAHFEQNPGSVIAGYDQAKAKFLSQCLHERK